MALQHETWDNGRLIRRRDDTARELTTWDTAGNPTSRVYTAAENIEADARALQQATADNEAAIRDRLAQAIAGNVTYLGLATPTAAQTTTQVKALTRQIDALIRLANRQLDADT